MDETTKAGPASPGVRLEVWRHMAQATDLLRAIVTKNAPRERFSRITLNQAAIFSYLFHSRAEGRPVRIKTLARNLDVSPAAASQAVERLVQAGVLERAADPLDRRAVRLAFTESGSGLVRYYNGQATGLIGGILAECPPEDVKAFSRVLGRLVSGLDRAWEEVLEERAAAEKAAKKKVRGRKAKGRPAAKAGKANDLESGRTEAVEGE